MRFYFSMEVMLTKYNWYILWESVTNMCISGETTVLGDAGIIGLQLWS